MWEETKWKTRNEEKKAKKKRLQLFGYKSVDMENHMMRARSTVNVNFAFNKIDSKTVYFFRPNLSAI